MIPKSEFRHPNCIIFLAAGGANRFGSPKQLAEFDGISLVRRACESALATGLRVFVVLGANAEAIAPEISGLDLTVVTNPGWQDGIGSSLKRGLISVLEANPATNAVLITLADQPLVGPRALGQLLTAFDETEASIAAARYDGTLGVPAIFGREHFASILALDDSKGAAGLIRTATDVAAVGIAEAAIDIDTPADLRAIHN